MRYLKVRSWHVYAFTSRGGTDKTRCGLWVAADAPSRDDLPMDERTCESCLRLIRHDEERPDSPGLEVPA